LFEQESDQSPGSHCRHGKYGRWNGQGKLHKDYIPQVDLQIYFCDEQAIVAVMLLEDGSIMAAVVVLVVLGVVLAVAVDDNNSC
jgi:hypothetical protein